jgi:hypothetical protein
MSMRTFNVALALALAACGSKPAVENKVEQAKADDRIECAIGAATVFADDCAMERQAPTSLTLRHADGGFRRLTLEADGTIDTADGAEAITVNAMPDGRTEITVGEDRYRLPSTL